MIKTMAQFENVLLLKDKLKIALYVLALIQVLLHCEINGLLQSAIVCGFYSLLNVRFVGLCLAECFTSKEVDISVTKRLQIFESMVFFLLFFGCFLSPESSYLIVSCLLNGVLLLYLIIGFIASDDYFGRNING